MGRSKAPDGLTDKQRLFVSEYMVDMNASAAAVRAGYSPKTARITAHNTLKNPIVAKAINAAKAKLHKKAEVDALYVLENAKRMFEKCMTDIPVLDSDGNPIGEYRFDSAGAGKALKIMGDHVAVNAFKAVDESGTPVDQNWKVTIVHTDARTHTARKT